ncbi:SRPBCC family protein [Nocardioides albidus]|uniref:SRPBCC family protein n=1 Tax=Nocardioides albidus TaxID=1517589 RepID=A0A5C4VTZ3_9ACTN|nr:SRPBCC family protein [Nocardioides albidus]TNM38659.1 SRPBCC family protein [Nocardioides albidus]
MTTLRSHTILDVPADDVWAVIRDVASIADWFPAMASSSGDERRRTVVLGDGSRIEEDIVTRDDTRRRLQYRAVGGDLPVAAHLGTVDVLDLEDGRSVVVYSTEIEPADLAPAFDGAVSEAVAGLGGFLGRTPAGQS